MVRSISPTRKKQEVRVCEHCKGEYPVWQFLANPVMPNGVDPFCYRCRARTETALELENRKSKPRRGIRAKLTTTPNRVYPHVRDAILARDGHRCRICHHDDSLEVHHIIPVFEGGSNHHGNLITLCANHHRLAHRGQITIKQLMDSLPGEASTEGYLPGLDNRRNFVK